MTLNECPYYNSIYYGKCLIKKSVFPLNTSHYNDPSQSKPVESAEKIKTAPTIPIHSYYTQHKSIIRK